MKRPVIWLNVFSWHDGTAMREKVVVSNAPLEEPRSGVVVCPVGPYPLSILDGYTGDGVPPLLVSPIGAP